MSRQYGIIGWPVEHSLSPAMHNAAFEKLQLDACYDRFAVEPDSLPEQVSVFRGKLSGWNVTVPHKEAIIELLDFVDPVASAARSVNTVISRGGRLFGYSTDGYGLQRALEVAFNIDVKGRHVLFVGAGGAVQAAAVQFASAGAKAVTLINRTVSKAEAVAERIRRVSDEVKIAVYPLAGYPDDMSDVDIIIQGTSVELKVGRELAFNFDGFRKACVCMDMIYNMETPFLKKAARHGMRTADGGDMLLYQGMKSFEYWTGRCAPEDVMREALNAALGC